MFAYFLWWSDRVLCTRFGVMHRCHLKAIESMRFHCVDGIALRLQRRLRIETQFILSIMILPQTGLARMGFSQYCPSSVGLTNSVVQSCRGDVAEPCPGYLWLTALNLGIWKSRNLEIWESRNLEIWESGIKRKSQK